jgi:hypothetical protein
MYQYFINEYGKYYYLQDIFYCFDLAIQDTIKKYPNKTTKNNDYFVFRSIFVHLYIKRQYNYYDNKNVIKIFNQKYRTYFIENEIQKIADMIRSCTTNNLLVKYNIKPIVTNVDNMLQKQLIKRNRLQRKSIISNLQTLVNYIP